MPSLSDETHIVGKEKKGLRRVFTMKEAHPWAPGHSSGLRSNPHPSLLGQLVLISSKTVTHSSPFHQLSHSASHQSAQLGNSWRHKLHKPRPLFTLYSQLCERCVCLKVYARGSSAPTTVPNSAIHRAQVTLPELEETQKARKAYCWEQRPGYSKIITA